MDKMNNALELKKLYESDDFISNSTYDGNDLGATYSPEATTFKVWAPVADSLKVCIYEKAEHSNMLTAHCGGVCALLLRRSAGRIHRAAACGHPRFRPARRLYYRA